MFDHSGNHSSLLGFSHCARLTFYRQSACRHVFIFENKDSRILWICLHVFMIHLVKTKYITRDYSADSKMTSGINKLIACTGFIPYN